MKRIVIPVVSEEVLSINVLTENQPVVVYLDGVLVGFVVEDQECEWSFTNGKTAIETSQGYFFENKELLCRALIKDGFTLFAGEVDILGNYKPSKVRSKN